MKKIIINFVIVISIMICYQTTKAQAYWGTNVYSAFNSYLGHNPLTSGPLDIGIGSTVTGYPINFWTSAGAYPFVLPNTGRMQIYDGAILPSVGFIGMGDFTSFTPMSQLHLHDAVGNANGNFIQLTNTTTTATGIGYGMRMGLSTSSEAQIRQEGGVGLGANYPLEFWVNASTTYAPSSLERMRIYAGASYVTNWTYLDDVTRVGIWENGQASAPYFPVSLLQLGEPSQVGYQGHRDWMDVGTYTNLNTDNIYVGLKVGDQFDQSTAIINWGDNPSDVANIGDRLIYNFSVE